ERATALLAAAEPVILRWYGEDSAPYLDLLDTRQDLAQNQSHNAEGLAIAERAVAIARRARVEPEHLFSALASYADALGRNGHMREAGAAAREALASSAFPAEHPLRIHCETILAMAEAATGSLEAAATRLRAQAALVRAQPIPMTLDTLMQLGEVEAELGHM